MPHRDRTSTSESDLLRENTALRAEVLALRETCHASARDRQQSARDRALLDEILGSRAWALVQGARRMVGRRGGLRVDHPSTSPGPHIDALIAPPSRLPQGPTVSVVVPNFNHEPYLEERLRSIFAQTYAPAEILFLDDGSTDGSLALARRLADESPVPFRFVDSGSVRRGTFRQWLTGIDHAQGDLVWIAESDDTCRPELLERLVPTFDDPQVRLAYCQSSRIGSDGQIDAPDYLDATEDLSPARWRHPYCVAGADEVECALSQRNTIPNASAVVFRRPTSIDERDELGSLRIGGDWLFYAMRIRDGKIAYLPEPLNGHRQHDRTVRASFERAPALFEEQLRVKSRIFEAFAVSASAITASLARGFAEHAERMQGLQPHSSMTERPELIPHLNRIREILRSRLGSRTGPPVLVVVSGLFRGGASREAIHLANALADRSPVFLANALPGRLDPSAAVEVDDRVLPIEGSLGLLPWSWNTDPGEAVTSARRAEVIRELVRFHQIERIHAQGPAAEELLAAAGLAAIPHLDANPISILEPRPEAPAPPIESTSDDRVAVLSTRIHALTLALHDARKRVAHLESLAASHVQQAASPAWRIGAAIDRASRTIAPIGSRRRGVLVSAARIARRTRRHRVITDPPASVTRPTIPIVETRARPNAGRILIADHDIPTPDLDAGSLRMVEIIRAIRGRGHLLTFLPDIVTAPPRYIDDLHQMGVELVGESVGRPLERYLREIRGGLDLAILSRPGVAARYLNLIRCEAPGARAVFDTVDLHYLREWRAARLAGDRDRIWEARRRKLQELALVRRCDATIVVSELERRVLLDACPGAEIRVLPTIVDIPPSDPARWEDRDGLVFIGGFRHAPNVDAVLWFVAEILPRILEQSPEMILRVVGPHAPEAILATEGPNVRVLGHVPDVGPILGQSRVAVAPLRFGAGVKGKVNLSMAHGLPTVVSTVAAEGMDLVHGRDALIAADPAAFADAVIELDRSRDLWERLSSQGRESVRARYSVEAAAARIDELLAFAGLGH